MMSLPAPRMRVGTRRYKFLRRLLNVRQMDFELALWEMVNLCIAPYKVFRNIKYHKQTKNQWARDDPAFLVLLSVCLCITSLGFSLYFWFPWWKTLTFTLWVVLVDCVLLGMAIATMCWQSTPHSVPEEVEWAYAFDVHCNSFFPLVLTLHVVQLVLMPIITLHNIVSVLVANTLYLVAVSYYVYITFLGYTALPFLGNTTIYLYPAAFFLVFYIIAVVLKWNLSVSVLSVYGITI